MAAPRSRGTVKWFNDAKGYGFITPEDGSKDLFVHYKEIEGTGHRSLADGDTVEYLIQQAEKGPAAVKVTKVTN